MTPGDPANDNSLHEAPTVNKQTASGDLRSTPALQVEGLSRRYPVPHILEPGFREEYTWPRGLICPNWA